MVSLTINGMAVQVETGMTILEAAKQAHIDIPTFCYDPELLPVGSCRMCVVEVEGVRLLQAACVTPVSEGIVVFTESASVQEARRVILELILANHKMDCLTCEKAGTCKLQDYCYRYNVQDTRFVGAKYTYPINNANPFIHRDYNKCIMCTRCVRVCEDICVVGAINVENRGHRAKITTAFDVPLVDSPCAFCGQCVMVCPTGALTSKVSAGKARTWEIDRKVLTTCTFCGTGCTLELNVKNNRIVGITSNRNSEQSPVNKGSLCVKGRFGWDFINSFDRLTDPLIKENGEFRKTTWEEALDLAATKLSTLKVKYGSDALAGLSSARITNEENYLMQKFVRAVLGTNNVDHCARL